MITTYLLSDIQLPDLFNKIPVLLNFNNFISNNKKVLYHLMIKKIKCNMILFLSHSYLLQKLNLKSI